MNKYVQKRKKLTFFSENKIKLSIFGHKNKTLLQKKSEKHVKSQKLQK